MGNLAEKVSTVATAQALHAWALVGNFLALVVLTVIMILFSYRAGRGGIISLILALYVGYAIFILFPYTEAIVNAGGTPLIKAIISVIIFAICSIIPFVFIQRLTSGGFGVLSFVPRFALSFLAAAFFMAIAYHLFQLNDIYSFPQPLDKLFAPDKFFFWWYIAPLIGLFIFIH